MKHKLLLLFIVSSQFVVGMDAEKKRKSSREESLKKEASDFNKEVTGYKETRVSRSSKSHERKLSNPKISLPGETLSPRSNSTGKKKQ